jgi:hypothetical protein
VRSFARGWALGGAALTVFSCLVTPGGLLSPGWRGDVGYYRHIGDRIVNGQIPYHDFYLEYPPGAIPIFALPSLFSQGHYPLVFEILTTIVAAVAVAAGVEIARRAGGSPARVALVAGIAPLAIGPVFLNRYDVWPAAIVTLALLALISNRPRLAFGLLAFAIVAKIYPIVVLPLAAVYVARRRGRAELMRCLAVLAAVGLAFIIPFAVVGFGGLGFSFYIQATRHLQIESLGAQLLVALDHLGLYHAQVFLGKPGSVDLGGSTASLVGAVSSLLELAAVLLVVRWYMRGRNDPRRLVLASAAAVTAFVALGKVLSPQYVVWLALLVPIVAGAAGLLASTLLTGAFVMTHLAFYQSDRVTQLGPVTWLVLSRNLVLLAVFVVLVRALRPEPER